MIVDDEPDILEGLSRILKRAGYDIIATSDGKEVLDLTIKNKPDLIILDIVLPNISGPQIATKISEFQQLKNIPIIFITGILSQEEEEKMDSVAGNRTVISKPCDPNTLLKIINYKIKEAKFLNK